MLLYYRYKKWHMAALKTEDKSCFHAKGSFNNYVDQSLPNFDPSLFEWTIVDILHDT